MQRDGQQGCQAAPAGTVLVRLSRLPAAPEWPSMAAPTDSQKTLPTLGAYVGR